MRIGQAGGTPSSQRRIASGLVVVALLLLTFGGIAALIGVARSASAAPAHSSHLEARGPSGGTIPPPSDGGRRPAPLTLVPTGWSASNHGLRSGGIERDYLMVRPRAGGTGKLPVVVVLSGRRLDPDGIERMSRLIPIVGRAIMIYPEGYGLSWNAGGCCGLAHLAEVNDVAFLNGVIHQVLTTQADASVHDIYLLGFSNGGRMAYRMACADPHTFAGVAAVEAVPVYDCTHSESTPLAIVAQRRDPLLTIATDGHRKTIEGYLEPTVGATVQRYRYLEGCAEDVSSLTTVGDARVSIFAHCHGTGRLEYVLYRGGAHVWPDGDADTPSAGRMIWSFLRHGGLPILVHAGDRPGHHRLT